MWPRVVGRLIRLVVCVMVTSGAAGSSNADTTTYGYQSDYVGGTIAPPDTVILNFDATVSGNVTVNGTLQFNEPGALTISSTILGTGTLSLTNTGTLDLTGTTGTTGMTSIANAVALDMETNVSGGWLQIRSGAGNLIVGNSGTGTLNVNGGSVSNTSGWLGYDAGSVGTATVSSGTWANSGDLTVGYSGTGELTMSGGFVAVGGTLSQGDFGTINLNSGGTLQIGVGGTTGVLGPSLVNNGTLIFNRSDASTYAGAISGAGSLTQQGTGTLTLTNANTYSGTTSISGGVLSLANASAIGPGTITFGGGTMQLTAASAIDYSSRILSSTSAIAIDTNGQSLTFSSPLVSSNTVGLAKSGTGTLTLPVGNLYSGTTTVTGGVLNIRNATALGDTSAGTVVNGGSLELQGGITVVDEALSLGAYTTAGLRNISGNNTWGGLVTLTAVSRINSDSGTLSLSNTSAIPAYGLTIDGAGDTNIAGGLRFTTGSLLKNGTGTLRLTGSNAWAGVGSLFINQGTVALSGSGRLGLVAGSNALFIAGGTLDMGGISDTVASTYGVQIQQPNSAILSGTLTTGVFAVSNNSGTATVSAVMSGTTGLTKSGSGTLLLTAANTYSGATNINGGSVLLTGAGSLGTGTAALTFNGVTALTLLDLGGLSRTVGALRIASGSTTLQNGSLTGTSYSVSNASGTATISASLLASGTTGLAKSGAGWLVLSNSNTYTGTTTVTLGALNIQNALALGGTAAGTVVNGGSLELQGGITVVDEALSLGAYTTAGLRNISGNNTWDGLVTLTATSRINSDSGTLTLSNLDTITGTTFALWVGGSANTVLNSILGTTTGGLVKDGTGTLTLTAANTYAGVTTINAGVLDLQNALALGGTAGGTTVAAGAALQLRGGITVVGEALSLGSAVTTGGLQNISGDNTWAGLVTLTAASRINSDSGTLTLSNVGTITGATFGLTVGGSGNTVLNSILGTTTGGLTKDGTGTLTLKAANIYTGVTTLSSGTLSLSNTFALQNSPLAANAGSVVFDSSVLGNAFTIGGLSGSLSIPLVNNFSTPAPVALTVSTITTTTYSGNLSGGGSLIKSLAGTLVLSGSNSYLGTTLISGGRLQFATTSSLYSGDTSSWTKVNIRVTTGGTLAMNVGGSGEFTTGNITTLLANLGGSVITAGLRAGSAIGFDTSNASGGTFTVADTIANTTNTGGGSVGLGKYGLGTLVLTGSNSYSGGTTLNGGTITLGNAFGLGNSGTSAFRINAGTLNLNGISVNIGLLSGSSGAVITTSAASGTTTLTAWNNSNVAASTYYGTIADNGDGKVALVMPAGGTLPLAGNNTFSGGTTIAATSFLELTGAGTLGSGPIVINGNLRFRFIDIAMSNAISGTGSLIVNGTAAILSNTFSNFTGPIILNNYVDGLTTLQLASLSGTGGGISIGNTSLAGTLRYVGSGNTTNRVLNMAGTTGGSTLDASGSGPLVFSSGMTATGAGIKTLTLTGSSTAANSIAAIPNSSAATSVNKTGNGTWRMTGTSSFTGQLTVKQGTILAAVGTGPSGNGVFGGATLPSLLPMVGDSAAGANGFAAMLLEAGVFLNRGLSVAALGSGATQVAILGGANTSGTSTFAYSTEIRIGRDVSLQAATGGTVDFGNVWLDSTGTGSPAFSYTIGTAGNLGTVRLSNPLATTSGSVSINYGTLKFVAGSQVASSTPLSIGSSGGNGTLNLDGNSLALSRLNFNGAGSFGGTVANSGTGTLTMQDGSAAALIQVNSGTAHAINSAVAMANNTTVSVANSAQIAINRAISGAFGLNKIGSGALTLSGNSIFSGATTVSAGTLVVNGSLASTAGLNVASGAFLGGSGSLASTIAGAGLVGPGNSPGILTALAVDPSAGTDFSFELTGTGAPAWSVASASVNDVLHLTSASPFTSTLNSSNAVNIYFQVASLAAGDTFQGGFFTDATLAQSDLLSNVAYGSFNFFVQGDGGGSNPYNGVNYYTFAEYLGLVPSITGIAWSSRTVSSANFATGTVTNGQVVELVMMVPEPSTYALAAIGAGIVGLMHWRKRATVKIAS